MYYGNIESDYFFLGIGLAACAYALREHESFYGFGPYLAFGGDNGDRDSDSIINYTL